MRLNLTQEQFGQLGGVQKNAQFLYEKGLSVPKLDYFVKMKAAGVDVLYLLSELLEVTGDPASTAPTAGDGERKGGDVVEISREWFKNQGISTPTLEMVEVPGDTMVGAFRKGDIVFCDPGSQRMSGLTMAAWVKDELMVATFLKRPDGVVQVGCLGPGYHDFFIDAPTPINVIGEVVAVLRRY